MNWTAVAAIVLAIGVILGAFGAHGLRDRLDAYSMTVYERAAFYHFIHALGMLAVGATGRAGSWTSLVCALLLAGIVLFSGSLYTLAITGQRWLGAVTPLGGVSFIAAWIVLAYAAIRTR